MTAYSGLVLLLLAAPHAFADAALIDSTPRPDAVIDGGTVQIDLKFDSPIDPKRSRVNLVTADEKSTAQRITVVMMPQDSPSELHASATHLTRGVYRVQWQVTGTDGHVSRDEYQFRVK